MRTKADFGTFKYLRYGIDVTENAILIEKL